MADQSPPPAPPLTLCLDAADAKARTEAVARATTHHAVCLFEDADGRPISLLVTANLKRLLERRLQPDDGTRSGSRRSVAARDVASVRAVLAGSSFEADWLWLQHARRVFPDSYRSLLDRWQTWFVHCNPEDPHPRWTKTAHPGRSTTSSADVYAGPFSDKHDAGRYLDLLEDGFDLCRYHHILVQAPNAAACAYKEMGRCPAPCDGSVTMQTYGEHVRESIDFAVSDHATWFACRDAEMQRASAALDFEQASSIKTRLDRVSHARKPRFAHVASPDRFRLISVQRSQRRGWARLFIIDQGAITPCADVPTNVSVDDVSSLLAPRCRTNVAIRDPFAPWRLEHMGLVCQHLFRRQQAPKPGAFIRLDDRDECAWIAPVHRAIRGVWRSRRAPTKRTSPMPDAELEDLSLDAGKSPPDVRISGDGGGDAR